MTESSGSQSSNLPATLSSGDQALVNKAFAESEDFRSVGERITAPLDSIIAETAKVLERDPILNVSKELEEMNGQMNQVYSEIIDNDGTVMRFFKSVPVLGPLASKLDQAIDSASFNIKDIEGKIASIFSGFDQAYESLNTAIDMQRKLLKGIERNLDGVIAYKNYLLTKIEEFRKVVDETQDEARKVKYQMFLRSVEFFQSNLVVLVGNLEMTRKRLLIRLDSSEKLALAMNSSKPIFKVLISSAVIEVSGQKAIDASMRAMQSMGQTIDKMSKDLTDRAIESNKRAEEMASRPVLSASVFVENVTKLKNHFDEIETYRQQVLLSAQKERGDFDTAERQLSALKTLSNKDSAELKEILHSGPV